ncbi:putative two-component system sensor kinase [Salmonella enterica subsp. enterica serovar Worthington str. ATCC 9607]|nr:putative two-component system sensor kinase [Salmonella enterica subsp. enterica serovar Worthington str. ATCC 9607]
MYEFNLVLLLLQQMCVFLVIAWLMSKTRLFIPLMQVTVRLPHKLLCYVTFSIFCIMGTYFGLHIEDSIANTRAIGAVMGGLLGGPVVGGLVGLTGGLHRSSGFYGRHDGAELYDFHHRRRAAGRVGTQRSHTSRTPGQSV